jgi:hypothetical protein
MSDRRRREFSKRARRRPGKTKRQVLTLGELSLLHTFSDIPVDEGALAVEVNDKSGVVSSSLLGAPPCAERAQQIVGQCTHE